MPLRRRGSGISRAGGAGLRWELPTACRRRFRVFAGAAAPAAAPVSGRSSARPLPVQSGGISGNKAKDAGASCHAYRRWSGNTSNPRPLSSFRNFHPARARGRMSARDAIARDENVRNPHTIAGGESDGKADRPPHRSPFPLSQEIPDIFIPPTQWAMPESCAGGMKIPE